MSLHAGLEQHFFFIFEAATKLPRKRAARIFYKVRNASTRREVAAEAIRPTLSPEGQQHWQAIYDRIIEVTGANGHRNFLGHGRVSFDPGSQGIFDSDIFDSAIFDTDSESRFFVSQDAIQVLAGQHQEREEGFDSAIEYCHKVIDLLGKISHFLAAYERGDLASQ